MQKYAKGTVENKLELNSTVL